MDTKISLIISEKRSIGEDSKYFFKYNGFNFEMVQRY